MKSWKFFSSGYISIDCGSPENFNYIDYDTGISYASDGAYIDTGINKNISSEYAYPNNPNLALPLSDLRSFPYGNKNCYTLAPTGGRKGSLYLIRASFLYGNYDGEDKLPEFDLYLDVNLWSVVKFRNASNVVTTEIISAAVSDTVSVCLVNKGLGTPFISALELRPLNSSVYSTEFGSTASLVLFKRLDIGYVNGTGRYSSDDIYDRIWSPYNSASWDMVSTSSAINSNENGYKAPLQVIRTAAMPHNASDPLELSWISDEDTSKFYVYMYFAEVQQLEKNQTRKFNISWNGSLMFGPLAPRYLYAATISNSEAFIGKEHRISIYRTRDATLPPILNAIEIYMAKQLEELPTFSEDGLIKISNLTSRGLSGMISASFGNLSSMESLNLEGNRLSGYVPTELVVRARAGLLNLSYVFVCTCLAEADSSNGEGRPLPSKKRKFTYAEVLNITRNFQDVIGKGGFGTVYRGDMKDGTQVAVKILSPSSTQGSKEFKTEAFFVNLQAELLMRVHHGNLVSFIGYCDDGSNMALIYEYMANGNLKDYLSYRSSNSLSWEMRLRIAIDAAQGLEYLHHGCKPPIIHRDVKTANILLSENMDAKIADFGLSRDFPSDGHSHVDFPSDGHSHVETTVMGTRGYLDPEGDIGSIVDQRLHGEFDVNSVWKALDVAMASTTPSSVHRAAMSSVLTELKQCLDMELSHNRERTQGFSEEIYVGSYNSTEMSSISTVTEPITIPFAR
ncbi:Serine-threonine/tyrosine-protein kinase [Theobroma cacao]|nr:Serine-threonine/tyrosine-protein kinase [Theobroma cacao]